jgi:hypothetical protein
MKNIIKTDNYLLIVSDEEMNDCWTFNLFRNQPYFLKGYYGKQPNAKKIIGHLPLNNSPILEGVDLLPSLEDEVDELADELTSHLTFPEERRVGIVLGYNKAKEKYKYTEEDIDKAYWAGMKFVGEDKGSYKEFIQSLQQPKYPIGFECEMVTRVFDVYPQTINHIPKTTTNSQGQTVLEGKYIYE